MTEPLVSVLIPVYNAGSFLRSSVESILSQTYVNLEVLIVDDGSTDNCTETITDLKDSRIHVVSQKHSGRATALNHGLARIRGEFYATHDADDISHPQRIERQVQAMQETPQLAAIFTGHDMILDNRTVAPRFAVKGVEQCRRDIEEFRMPAHDPTGMFRIQLVHGIRYEETLLLCAGWDYILRVGERLPMSVLGECLYSYRVHSGASTRQDRERRKRMMRRLLERACERRGLDFDDYLGPDAACRIVPHRDEERGVVPHFMESVLDLRRSGRRVRACATGLACARRHPLDPCYYKPLVYSLTPEFLITCYRRRKPKGKLDLA